MTYTPAVATAGSILLIQRCIFRLQGVYCWVRGVHFGRNLQLQHRETENLFLQWKDHFPPVLTRKATPPYCIQYLLYYPGTTAKPSHKFSCHYCQRNWEAGCPTASSNHCFMIARFWERLGHDRALVVSQFQDASERLFVMAPTLAWLQRCFGDGLVA